MALQQLLPSTSTHGSLAETPYSPPTSGRNMCEKVTSASARRHVQDPEFNGLPHELRASKSEGEGPGAGLCLGQQREIRIRRLERRPVTPGTRRDQDIRRRHRHAGGARTMCQLAGCRPYLIVDAEFGQHRLELAQDLPVPTTGRTAGSPVGRIIGTSSRCLHFGVLVDECVTYPGSLAKYAAAFFKISRSSTARRSWARSLRISLFPPRLKY